LRFPIAKTKLQGKFSLNYCMAQIILKGELNLEDFDGEAVDDPKVIALMERIEVIPNDHMNSKEHMLVRGDTIITVKTKKGETFSERVNYATGDPRRPMTEDMRFKKLRNCLSRTIKADKISEVIHMLESVETLSEISILIDTLGRTVKTAFIYDTPRRAGS
jgi:2-methylcitrate dehydratase PrpD